MVRVFLYLCCIVPVLGANLDIQGDTSTVYDGGTYDALVIFNSRDVVVRNCSFGTNSGTVVNIAGNSSYITLENCDIDGRVDACTGVSIGNGANHITFRNCYVHNIADDGFSVHSVRNVFFYGNTIAHLHGCGTDGGCGPCYNGHSDGLELFSVDTCVIDGNLIYDVTSTGAIFSSMWDTYNSEWTVTNNVFYTPKTGITVYLQQTDGLRFYNNIVWGSLWQGLALGQGLTRLDVKNNVLQNINYTHLGAVYDSLEHDIDYNLLADNDVKYGYVPNAHDIEDSTHRFTVVPVESADHQAFSNGVARADFAPVPGSRSIDAGTAFAGIPTVDVAGNERYDDPSVANTGAGTAAYYDMGVFEYGPDMVSIARETSMHTGPGTVWPNPSNNTVVFNGVTDGTVAISDASGRTVFIHSNRVGTGRDPSQKSRLEWYGTGMNNRAVPPGLYFYTITDETGIRTGTIIRTE